MVVITIATGAYKPTYNWGASYCIDMCGFWKGDRLFWGHIKDSWTRYPTEKKINGPSHHWLLTDFVGFWMDTLTSYPRSEAKCMYVLVKILRRSTENITFRCHETYPAKKSPSKRKVLNGKIIETMSNQLLKLPANHVWLPKGKMISGGFLYFYHIFWLCMVLFYFYFG